MFVVGLVSVLNFKYLILLQVQYDLNKEQVQKTRKDQCKNDFNKKIIRKHCKIILQAGFLRLLYKNIGTLEFSLI